MTLGKTASLVKLILPLQYYKLALDIYKKFDCTNLGDFHDVYLKTDVLFLAYIFEKFRSVCLSVNQLGPAHFYSAPNLSWESMLISTRVKLGLLEEVDTLLFFERGIRDGINGLGALRHFNADNPHLNTFDPSQKTTFSAFYDVTSLYTGPMKNDASGKLQVEVRHNCQTNFGNSRKF